MYVCDAILIPEGDNSFFQQGQQCGVRCTTVTLELIWLPCFRILQGRHSAKQYAWSRHIICMFLYSHPFNHFIWWTIYTLNGFRDWDSPGSLMTLQEQSCLPGHKLQNNWAYCSSFQGQCVCVCAILAGSVGAHALQYYVVVMRLLVPVMTDEG